MKWTWVCPVWYQLRKDDSSAKQQAQLTGKQDVNLEWMEALRGNVEGVRPLIVPRIVFEMYSLNEEVRPIEV